MWRLNEFQAAEQGALPCRPATSRQSLGSTAARKCRRWPAPPRRSCSKEGATVPSACRYRIVHKGRFWRVTSSWQTRTPSSLLQRTRHYGDRIPESSPRGDENSECPFGTVRVRWGSEPMACVLAGCCLGGSPDRRRDRPSPPFAEGGRP